MSESIQLCCRQLVGQQLLKCEVQDQTWSFCFSGEVIVQTESSWRLVDATRVVVSSEDHGHPFGLPAPVDAVARVTIRTVDQTVTAAHISPTTGDLTIDFGGGVHIQLLQLSCGYESWRLGVKEMWTYCCGGGRIDQDPEFRLGTDRTEA